MHTCKMLRLHPSLSNYEIYIVIEFYLSLLPCSCSSFPACVSPEYRSEFILSHISYVVYWLPPPPTSLEFRFLIWDFCLFVHDCILALFPGTVFGLGNGHNQFFLMVERMNG